MQSKLVILKLWRIFRMQLRRHGLKQCSLPRFLNEWCSCYKKKQLTAIMLNQKQKLWGNFYFFNLLIRPFDSYGTASRFHPKPKVDSTLIRLDLKQDPICFSKGTKALIRTIFTQRRKEISLCKKSESEILM